ncbi:unnamed protein product [Pedinophyceae sp. YPF-701]|nr:unnamed protein product [Pedinophyceae sp. YPF-701]
MSVLGFSGRQNSGTAGHGDSDGTAARLGRLWVGSEDGDGSGSEGGSSRPGRAHARGFESVGKRQSSVAASGTGTPTVPGNDAGSEAGHSQEPGHGTPEVRLTKAQKKNLKRAEKKANKRAAELAARASTAGEPSEGGDDDGGASDDGGSQPGGRARSQAGMTHAEAMAAAVAASEDAPDQPPAPPPAAAQQPPPAQTQTQAPAPAPAPQQQPADVFNEAVACLVAAKMQQHVADLTLLSFPAWRASVAVQKFGSDVRSALAWLLEGNATTEAEARAIAEGLAASDSAPEVTFDIDGELAMLHAVESAVPAGGPSPWSAVVASQGNVRRTLDMLVRAGALMTEQAVACAARLAVQMYGGPPAAQAARRPAEQQREQAPPASLGLQSPVAAQEQPPGMLHLQQQQPALSAEHQQQQAPQQGGSGMFPSFQWPPSSSAATSQPLSGAGLQSLLTAMGGGQARSPGLSTSGPGSAFQDPAIAGMGQRLPLSSPDPPHGARPPGMGARPPPPGLGGGSGTTEQRASLLRALGLGGASAGEQAGAGLTPGGAAPMNGGLSQGFGTSAYDPFLFARPAGAK